jgi:proteasome lid subunit RPN8/RPN11
MSNEVPLRLAFSVDLAAQLRGYGADSYPNECCGALLGRDVEGAREVLALYPLVNRREDSPRNRFSITPQDVLKAQQAARRENLDVVGWYHSHPDHPARPSEYDREHAWPWYSYVILSVVERAPKEMTSWRLADDRSAFGPEEIEIRARASA